MADEQVEEQIEELAPPECVSTTGQAKQKRIGAEYDRAIELLETAIDVIKYARSKNVQSCLLNRAIQAGFGNY